MSPEITLIIYLSIGITAAFTAINLIIGLQKIGDSSYMFLGLIGVCVTIYTVAFPFVIANPDNSLVFKIGMFFFLMNFGLLPWFFCSYTGYCNNKVQWILSSGMALSYILMLLVDDIYGFRLWNILAHLVLVAIIIFGFVATYHQSKKGEVNTSRWLGGSLIVFSVLTIDDIVRVHMPSLYPINILDHFLPFDYFLILFMIVMSLKLARDIQLKFLLEKSVNLQEKRWSNFLDKVNLLVIGVDSDRNVNYVNPFFLKTTGYIADEIIGNHYINIFPEGDRDSILELSNTVSSREDFQYYQNTILTNNGETKIINWAVVGMYDDIGNLINSISIGSDITDKEKAIAEIKNLKNRLEEENILLKAELGKTPIVDNIVGKSDAIRYVLQRAMQVASTDTNVLLEGETGVGKELVTNYIQQKSNRKDKPFIKINCSAIPDSLFESELFGYIKGAFTGADRNKKGLVEMADGGTLFLDEIGEFPLELQPKLLRFLQEGEYVPLGSESSKKVNVRIIAATNRELLKEIEKGNFRNDLYYRLYVYPITIPALRNRADDIPELVDVFLKKYRRMHGKKINSISKLVISDLKKYPWPGNIRELENVIERAVIISTTETIKTKDLSLVLGNLKKPSSTKESKLATLADMERNHIIVALKQTNWQIHGPEGAAQILGINPNTLRSRIKKLNISKPE